MTNSFFHLTPDNDDGRPHICADCAAEIAAEPDAETHANMDAAIALGDHLLEAIDTYADIHEHTTYRHIFEALAYMHWMLHREMEEDAEEPEDATPDTDADHTLGSFFPVTASHAEEDHPGISADQETWDAVCEALRDTLNDCHDTYPDLTWGDIIHAAKYLAHDLIQSYHDDTAEA